jgi:hypothetical protein
MKMKKKIILAIIFLTINIIFSPLEAKTNKCKTPSGRIVDCKLLEEAKQIIAIKKAKEENERLQAELEAQRRNLKNNNDKLNTTETSKARNIQTDNNVTREAELIKTEKNKTGAFDDSKIYAPTTLSNIPPSDTPNNIINSEAKADKTISTEISKEKSDFEKNFAAAIENGISRSFKGDSNPINNNFKVMLKYSLSEHNSIKIEPGFAWKWTETSESSNNFWFNDLPIVFNNWSLYENKKISFNIEGNFVLVLPTSVSSRNAGVISYFIANAGFRKDISGGNGNIVIRPEIAFAARRHSTSAPTANDESSFFDLDPSKRVQFGDSDVSYEILDPYDQFTINVNTTFWHKIAGGLSFCTWFRFVTARLYGDYVMHNGVQKTISPERWSNSAEFSQELKYEFSESVHIKTGLASTGALSGFKPFNTSDGNNVTWWFTFIYDFYNKAS